MPWTLRREWYGYTRAAVPHVSSRSADLGRQRGLGGPSPKRPARHPLAGVGLNQSLQRADSCVAFSRPVKRALDDQLSRSPVGTKNDRGDADPMLMIVW